jgi:tRNA (cmo5U34)-methyltransferase
MALEDPEQRLSGIERDADRESDEWHLLARRYQTRYDEMLGEVIARARVQPPYRILDLGAGSGILAELMLRAWPAARLTLLDFSAGMLAAARRRLGRDDFEYVQSRFEDMPAGPFDSVLSTLALHHLETHAAKQQQYQRVFDALAPGGSFWQGEYVLAESPEDSEHNELCWARWLAAQGFSADEISELQRRVATNDRPESLMTHLALLKEVGFDSVDCTWRYQKFAVLGGWKPAAVDADREGQ